MRYNKFQLRVNNLLLELMSCAYTNLEAHAYLRTIYNRRDNIDYIKTEQHLLNPDFLNNKCFSDLDREKMMPIIREYKLNDLFNAKDII
jgi:hypothetical protein